MSFGTKIKSLRTTRGISLKSLSSLLKIDRAYLSRVEAGKVPPSDGLITKLADALKCDGDELFLLAGRLPKTILEEVYNNPAETLKRLKMSLAGSVAEPTATYGRTLISTGDRAIEDGFPFAFISEIAELESYRKEVNRPIYHMHKWWAQRLGTVFRSILIGAAAPKGSNIEEMFYQPVRMTGMTVFDPFMGSGTTVGEALKLGCRVIGRDINPVSYFIVKNELNSFSREDVVKTFRAIEKDVFEKIKGYYKGKDSKGQVCDVLYYFWVKTVDCPKCNKAVDLFSSYIFSRHAYPARNPEARALCPGCGAINLCRYDSATVKCGGCKRTLDVKGGPAQGTQAVCPSCLEKFPIARTVKEAGNPPSHRMYAKIVLRDDGTKEYRPTDGFDEALYLDASAQLKKLKNAYPVVLIQPGYNTNQALNYNYRFWHEMFNDRQLLVLSILAGRIREIEDEAMRELFACLFSGCLEFNNMFASFKGEGTGAVRHMFSHHILKPERTPLEANLWGTPKSSGAFSTLFQSRLLRALEYRQNPFELRCERVGGKLAGSKVYGLSRRPAGNIADTFREFSEGNMDAYLSCGDSSDIDLADASVDLVVTDPPFFDNVHYSELADFFYVWLRHIFRQKAVFGPLTTRASGEVQQADPSLFVGNLTKVFKECHRVLRPEGLLIFTYHHSRHEGWLSVMEAIFEGGFVVTKTHPVKAELSVATPKQQAREPIDLDIIIVCRKREEWELNERIGPDIWERVRASASAQIARFNSVGRRLSRNDIRVVLMGQLLSALTQTVDLEKVLLAEGEDRTGKEIEGLFSNQAMKEVDEVDAQMSFLSGN